MEVAAAAAAIWGITATAWSAPVLPGSNPEIRELEQNRGSARQQSELKQAAAQAQPPAARQQKLLVQKFVFTGQEQIAAAELEKVTQSFLGREITVKELEQAAAEVTGYCRSRGYTVATAVIPQQNIANDTVEIRIFLGTLGKVTVENHSRLSQKTAAAFAAAMQGKGYVRTSEIETVLNNFNDLPGISAAGILSAGSDLGSSDLTITVSDKQAVESVLYTDNYGGKYSGPLPLWLSDHAERTGPQRRQIICRRDADQRTDP